MHSMALQQSISTDICHILNAQKYPLILVVTANYFKNTIHGNYTLNLIKQWWKRSQAICYVIFETG